MSLDPKTTAAAQAAARAKKSKPAPLDPPFPFRPVAFDPWLFGVQNDTPKIKDPSAVSAPAS